MRIVGIGLRSPSRGRARPLPAAMKRRTHPGSHDHVRGARYQTAARPTRPILGVAGVSDTWSLELAPTGWRRICAAVMDARTVERLHLKRMTGRDELGRGNG